MGIRIHKVLGYGLLMSCDLYKNKDMRINYNFIKNLKNEIEFNKEHLINFLQNKLKEYSEKKDFSKIFELKELINFILNKDFDFYDFFIYNTESSDNNLSPIIFIPPYHKEQWFRYNDDIDYQEYYYDQKGDDYLKLLSRPIYPYESYFSKKKNDNLKDLESQIYSQIKKGLYQEESYLKQALSKINCESIEEMNENIFPYIPFSIEVLCEYFDIFTEKEYFYQLRPMIYVYWS